MKLYQFIISAITAFTLFSCSAEDNNGLDKPIVPAGEPATLKLTITDPVTRTRAEGGSPRDTLITDISIFIFREDGYTDRRPLYIELNQMENQQISALEINVTTATKEIYIIANVGSDRLTQKIGSESQLKAEQIDLMKKETNGNYSFTQESSKLCMTGVNSIVWAKDSDIANVSIDLKLKCAKIIVLPDVSNLSNNPSVDGINIDGVILLYAGAKMNYFTTNFTQTHFYSATKSYSNPMGLNDPNVIATDTVAPNKLFDEVKDSQPKNSYYFYTFPNDEENTGYPTIVALRGTKKDTGEVRYWSVRLPKVDAGVTYRVKMNLTGSTAGNADGGSEPNPETVTPKGFVNTTITKTNWTIDDTSYKGEWE